MSLEFCFASVCKDDIPLVQYISKQGNYDTFFDKLFQSGKIEMGKNRLISDNFFWGIQKEDNGLIFVCVLKNTTDNSLLDKALDDIKSRFIRSHGGDWKKCAPFGLQTEFEPQLTLVKNSILSFAGVGSSLLDSRPLDELEDDQLDQSLISDEKASRFDPSLTDGNLIVQLEPLQIGAAIKKNWKKIGIWVLIAFLIAIIIYAILALICGGFDLSPRCF